MLAAGCYVLRVLGRCHRLLPSIEEQCLGKLQASLPQSRKIGRTVQRYDFSDHRGCLESTVGLHARPVSRRNIGRMQAREGDAWRSAPWDTSVSAGSAPPLAIGSSAMSDLWTGFCDGSDLAALPGRLSEG